MLPNKAMGVTRTARETGLMALVVAAVKAERLVKVDLTRGEARAVTPLAPLTLEDVIITQALMVRGSANNTCKQG